VNKAIPNGFSMIANPVVAADNSFVTLFSNAPVGTSIFKFDPGAGTFVIYDYTDLNGALPTPIWNPSGAETLVPGEGIFIYNPGTEYTVTFTGEVAQNAQSNITIAGGFSIISSVVAQGGALQTALGFPAADGDSVFKFDNSTNQYVIHDYTTLNRALPTPIWNPSEPSVDVAESFFVYKADQVGWNRNFDPNAGS